MAKREDLRRVRTNTVINVSSKKMESGLIVALNQTVSEVELQFGVKLVHHPKVLIKDIVAHLRQAYPDIPFEYHFDNTSLLPDGGILSVEDKSGNLHVVLISEVKRQGTNDLRAEEGLAKQAKGNAIERLGKNVIGFRTWMSTEGIFPFVVFGQGVDFSDDSSILDRVSTIAMFAPLNKIEVTNLGENGNFNRGSFFFRSEAWTAEEMSVIMTDIVRRSLFYYFAKFGDDKFVTRS